MPSAPSHTGFYKSVHQLSLTLREMILLSYSKKFNIFIYTHITKAFIWKKHASVYGLGTWKQALALSMSNLFIVLHAKMESQWAMFYLLSSRNSLLKWSESSMKWCSTFKPYSAHIFSHSTWFYHWSQRLNTLTVLCSSLTNIGCPS